MRIAFLCTSSLDYPSPRGRWLPLAHELVRLGHVPHLLMLHPSYDRLSAQERAEFRVGGVRARYVAQMHVYGMPGARRSLRPSELLRIALQGMLALGREALRLKPDLVLAAKPQPINGPAALFVARMTDAPLHVDCDDYEAGANRFTSAWQRRLVAKVEDRLPLYAKLVLSNTHFTEQRLLRLGLPAEGLRYLPNGITAAQRQRPDAHRLQALRQALGLQGHPTLLYLGAISTVAHGLGLLLDAFVVTRRSIPNARLLIVGDGDDRPALMHKAQALGLTDALLWTGHLPAETARSYLALADASVDPVFDTPGMAGRSPLKIVESMAQAVPVITGDVGDRHETLAGSGMIVPHSDAAALGDAISRLLGDRALRETLAQASYARSEEFLWWKLIRAWM